jgi:hypothetical protein
LKTVTMVLRNGGASALRAVPVSLTSSVTETWFEDELLQVGDLTPVQETRSTAIPLTITYYGQGNV